MHLIAGKIKERFAQIEKINANLPHLAFAGKRSNYYRLSGIYAKLFQPKYNTNCSVEFDDTL